MGPRVVLIGGGHGLPVAIAAALDYAEKVSAIVTVADDGGSSGVLSGELGVLPPGDSRNCLVAMAGNARLARLFQYRFDRGEGLEGHALGNLVLAALSDMYGGFAPALQEAADLLEARGTVLPPTTQRVTLRAEVAPNGDVSGQCNVANRLRPIRRIYLEPAAPQAHLPAVAAIEEADQIVLGPGSLFTSVMPNLLVPGIADALRRAVGHKVFVCNTVIQPGETDAMTAADHIRAFEVHVGKSVIDVAIVNSTPLSEEQLRILEARKSPPLERQRPELQLQGLGIEICEADVGRADEPSRHDPEKLADVLAKTAHVRSGGASD